MNRLLPALVLLAAAACAAEPDAANVETAPPIAGETATIASADAPLTVRRAHAAAPAVVSGSDTVVVYKSPSCGCCRAWVDHMRESGFTVVAIDTSDVQPVKQRLGVAADLGSCHTATVGGYVVEGHVPAADIRRLLAERPKIRGIATPGMPMGSPGMEGPVSQRYDVIAFDAAGKRSIFASH